MKIVICAIIKDEHKFLKEWIEWNLQIGFTHIYLYEDYGSKSHNDITKEIQQVTLQKIEDIEIEFNPSRQCKLYNWFIKTYKNVIDWCAFIDIDEFMQFQKDWNLQRLCETFKKEKAVQLWWKYYGCNGHISSPEGKVQDLYHDNYCPQLEDCSMYEYKSFVNMKYSTYMKNVHRHVGMVNTDFGTTDLRPKFNTRTYSKCWIDHYRIKSFEDYCNSLKRGNITQGLRTLDLFFLANPELNERRKELEFKYLGFGFNPNSENSERLNSYINSIISNKQRTVIVSIIKDEQLYLEEWIDHYKNIADKIIIFEDYNSSSHKTIVDKHENVYLTSLQNIGIPNVYTKQMIFFKSIIFVMKGKCNWLGYFDNDEYLEIDKEFYNRNKDVEGVLCKWKNYGFNNRIYYEDIPLKERFTSTCIFAKTQYRPYKNFINEDLFDINRSINSLHIIDQFNEDNNVVLHHYFTKSWEEWCWRFLKRGDILENHKQIEEFFEVNEIDSEKRKELMKLYYKWQNEYSINSK